MNCRKCSSLLSAFIDGELPEHLARSVEEHIASCPRCAAELGELRAVDTITHQTVETRRPAKGFAGKVLSKLPPSPALSSWNKPAALFLLLLLAVISGSAVLFSVLKGPGPAKEEIRFHTIRPRDGLPSSLPVPFDIAWNKPLGLRGPGVLLSFLGRISVRSTGEKQLRIYPAEGSLLWLRTSPDRSVSVHLPDGTVSGPVRQAFFDLSGPGPVVCNLWKTPLASGGESVPPGFRLENRTLSLIQPPRLAGRIGGLAEYFPSEASIPLDWTPSRPGRLPRRTGLRLIPGASPELLGEAPPGRPLALVFGPGGDTVVLPDAAETRPPFRSAGAAWPLDELLAALPQPEGKLTGITLSGDVFFRLDGANKFTKVVPAPSPRSILNVPLAGFFVLFGSTGIVSLDTFTGLVGWREARLKDTVGTAVNENGDIWSAQKDGTLILLSGKDGRKIASHGPAGQAFVSPPVRTASGWVCLAEKGRLLRVTGPASSTMEDLPTGGPIDAFTASEQGAIFFHRDGKWFRLDGRRRPEELGPGGPDALLLGDGSLLCPGPEGLRMIPSGRTLVFEGPGNLMVGTGGVYYVTSGGKVFRLPASSP